ncbi:unnamed protein product [Adineta ricciae]|uniref:Uncharacterized protein n=1 Tax=Adineta ricciae TaxID=249248 RepID=A0A815VEQ4_ADIRI|nr:unnamed protein product [Adineta ricciae]
MSQFIISDPLISPFNSDPLIYNSTATRFPPNTTISIMFKEMMIEQWNPSSSYEVFYGLCAPKYCTYSQRIRTQNFSGVIVTLISMVGGIVVSLRIGTPYFVKFILKLLTIFKKNTQQKVRRERVKHGWFNRMKIMGQNMMKRLAKVATELNIFSAHNFGSNVNRSTVISYGRSATRLYILLFIISLTILIFYTIIRPHTAIKTFEKLSLTSYQNFHRKYGNKLKCPCSKIASTYNESLEIKPIFHSICSSDFTTDKWRVAVTNNLISNLSVYSTRDYRRFISAHIQYLQGLCRISKEVVNNAINEFLSSLLVTVELLSEQDFHNRLNTLVKQSELNAPILLSRFLFITRIVYHGNAFMSTYGTNFIYATLPKLNTDTYAYTEAMVYDNNCSCGISSNCTTQATFVIDGNPSKIFPIEGLKMGCTASESFRLSTLECFYNQSCLSLIHRHTNYQENHSISILNISHHFPPNTTINELIDKSFVEQWSIKPSYTSYYYQCMSLLCSYTYIETFNILYIITLFLSFQGGLTLVLKWVCPKIVRIFMKIYFYYTRQRSSIHPVSSLEMSLNNIHIDTANADVDIRTTDNITTKKTINSSIQWYSKIILIVVLLIFLIVAIIIFSIYHTKNEPPCQFKFQQRSINISCHEGYAGNFLIATADFNNDNQADLIYYCQLSGYQKMLVLLGDDNGTFQNSIIIPSENVSGASMLHTADFNNDNRSDVILLHEVDLKRRLTLLLSNGDGTFEANMLSIIIDELPRKMTVNDLNNDKILDIVMIMEKDPNVYVMFGNRDGDFSIIFVLFTELYSELTDLVVGDVNNDTYVDIVVYDYKSSHIYVFFGSTNGTFQAQKPFFTSFKPIFSSIAIGDFDNDYQFDIANVHYWKDIICTIYQYNNRRFNKNKNTTIKSLGKLTSIVIGNINGDNYLDIILALNDPYRIYGLLGYGNGRFYSQEIHWSESIYAFQWFAVNDFNNDGYQDIISASSEVNIIDIFLNKGECSTI